MELFMLYTNYPLQHLIILTYPQDVYRDVLYHSCQGINCQILPHLDSALLNSQEYIFHLKISAGNTKYQNFIIS